MNLYTKHKHPMELVPIRIRQFFYFAFMPWISLFCPDEGQELVDCANEGANKRIQDSFRESLNTLSQRKC